MARDKQNDWRAGLGSSLGLDQCSSVLVKGGEKKVFSESTVLYPEE